MRRILKSAFERSLTSLGTTTLARRQRRAQILVLAYHNIVPNGEPRGGDLSLHLPQQEFARQLDELQRTHDVIPLADLCGAPNKRPRAVITFDDAYAGAVEVGVDELRKRSLPATIFVAPALLNGASFWWDVLAARDSGLAADVRAHALQALEGRCARIEEWAAKEGLPLHEPPWHQRGCSESSLAAAAASGLITFGSHTWSHPNLARLSGLDAARELTQSWQWLRSRFSNVLPYLAYPYGLHRDETPGLVAQAGYAGAFLIEGGWIAERTLATARFRLPRLNVAAGISLRGFALRTAGVL